MVKKKQVKPGGLGFKYGPHVQISQRQNKPVEFFPSIQAQVDGVTSNCIGGHSKYLAENSRCAQAGPETTII